MSTLLRLSTPRLEKAIARAKVGNGTTFTVRAPPSGLVDGIAMVILLSGKSVVSALAAVTVSVS